MAQREQARVFGEVAAAYSAQAWHWLDPATRIERLHDALAPGGVVALFLNRYLFADRALQREVDRAYRTHAPQLVAAAPDPTADDAGYALELGGSGRFTDLRTSMFHQVVRYPTGRYQTLLQTFSAHRMLPDAQRAALHGAIAEVLDAHGGGVDVDLATALALARRPPRD